MDRELVEAARNRDREVYADLILRDVDRAEYALQDALVIAWRDRPGSADGQTLLVAIEVPDKAIWDTAIANAMPVVQTFEFIR